MEKRIYDVVDAEDLPNKESWKNLKSLIKVIRERTSKEKTTTETIYYISSCEIDAKLSESCVRGHWGVENSLHWRLDVIFREDNSRYRDRIGARNLAAVRKIVCTLVSKDKSRKCGGKTKRLIALHDESYREYLLKILF